MELLEKVRVGKRYWAVIDLRSRGCYVNAGERGADITVGKGVVYRAMEPKLRRKGKTREQGE